MNRKRAIQVFCGVLIGAFGLYLFLRGVNLRSLGKELRSTNIPIFLLGCCLNLGVLYLRSIRWKFMLPDLPSANTKNLYSYVMIGFMVNNLLPARIGEAARAFLLWRKNRYPAMVAIGTLVIERIIDLIVLMSFLFIPVFFLPQLSSLRKVGFIVFGLFVGSILAGITYMIFPQHIKNILSRFIGIVPHKFRGRASEFGKELGSSFDWLFSIRRCFFVILLSFPCIFGYALVMILLIGDLNRFGFFEGLFAAAFAALGAAIPLAPGYVGTLHAVMFQGLSYLGIGADEGRAMTILYHMTGYIPVTILGLIFFLGQIFLSGYFTSKKYYE